MRPLSWTLLLAACSQDFFIDEPKEVAFADPALGDTDVEATDAEPPAAIDTDAPDTDASPDTDPTDTDPADPVADSAVDTDVLVDTDTDVALDTAVDTGTPCPPAFFRPTPFAFPPDALSCNGPQFIRFDRTQNLFVGITSCGGTSLRIYLSRQPQGPFVPALDVAGHGQDHCELIDPNFRIVNEDDITSGGCTRCGTSINLPIENAPGWARAFFGDPFTFVPQTGPWSWQTSQIDCAVVPQTCVP
jgi:hypothetical protein